MRNLRKLQTMPLANKRIITSKTIIDALARRHSKDVFIPECKTGSSWFDRYCRRLDAWAMKRSWKHPLAIGYEAKVTRGDFMKDDKWHAYLDYCNEFYFVCPSKVINPKELPKEAGLMYISANGARVYTKKKAPRRRVDIPKDLYRYILMARSSFCSEYKPKEDSLVYWQKWLERKHTSKEVGLAVGRKVRDAIFEAQREAKQAKQRAEEIEDRYRLLKEIGLDLNTVGNAFEFRRKLQKLTTKLPPEVKRSVTNLKRIIFEIENSL